MKKLLLALSLFLLSVPVIVKADDKDYLKQYIFGDKFKLLTLVLEEPCPGQDLEAVDLEICRTYVDNANMTVIMYVDNGDVMVAVFYINDIDLPIEIDLNPPV